MDAAVLMAANKMELTQVDTPTAGPGELVLRVKAACICGTDLRVYRGKKTDAVTFPQIIGHEFSGEVAEIGQGVAGFRLGDPVVVFPDFVCGECLYCKAGQENLCLNPEALGFEYDGAFAEYVKIPAKAVAGKHVYTIPAGTSWEGAAIVEPLSCCLNGQERAGVTEGDSVVILGGGAIGMMHLQLAKAAGARHVLVSEPSAVRRGLAEQLGADTVCDPTGTDLRAVIDGITAGLGADVVIVAIGIPALASRAVELVRKRGRINLFAGFSTNETSEIDVNLIHYNELIVTGTCGAARRHFESALDLILTGKVRADDLVTHHYPLKEISDAFASAESGLGLKVAVKAG